MIGLAGVLVVGLAVEIVRVVLDHDPMRRARRARQLDALRRSACDAPWEAWD